MDIAIIDFGSQYTNLIRALLDDLGVESTILPNDTQVSELRDYKGIIISGGPASVYNPHAPTYSSRLFEIDLPILGICYGHQLMAYTMGGKVVSGLSREYGRVDIAITSPVQIFSGLKDIEPVWMSHSDTVIDVPSGFEIVAKTDSCPVAAMANLEKRRFGVQFHPEVSQTICGVKIIQSFIEYCGCQINADATMLADKLKIQIRQDVGNKNVFLMLSGGVDSNVAFVLLINSLEKQKVYGLHIDTGLLRKGETDSLITVLKKLDLVDRLKIVDASSIFFTKLKGVLDAEAKRKIVASTFLEVKDQVMADLGLSSEEWLMGQGTIYTDLITSGLTAQSKTIKTHHNSLLQERQTLPIIEPLKSLYKHQVRSIGVKLGLPSEMVWKEPYPGPGNSVRILGEVTRERADLQRRVDSIVTTILKSYGYDKILFQGFPVLGFVSDFDVPQLNGNIVGTVSQDRLQTVERANEIVRNYFHNKYADWQVVLFPFKTVGIKGDNRSFAAPIMIRLNQAEKKWGEVDYAILENLSSNLTNELDTITRVVYDITPASINDTTWEKIAFLRLITSREAMTVDWAKITYDVLGEISSKILDQTDISRVMLDVTQKPPGMVEWE